MASQAKIAKVLVNENSNCHLKRFRIWLCLCICVVHQWGAIVKNLKFLLLASLTLVIVNCSPSTKTEYFPSTNGSSSSNENAMEGAPSSPSDPFAPTPPSTPSSPTNPSTPINQKVEFHLGAPVVSGTRLSFKLSSTVYFSSDDLSKQGYLFVALQLANGELWFANSNRQWTKFNGIDAPAPFAAGVVPVNLNVTIADGENISDASFDGAVVYIGYGLSNVGATEAFNEMTTKLRYLQLYRIL